MRSLTTHSSVDPNTSAWFNFKVYQKKKSLNFKSQADPIKHTQRKYFRLVF